MAVVRGIFVLGEVVEEKFSNTWTNLGDVWIDQIPDTGYFVGGVAGSIPGTLSTVDKFVVSSDTTSLSPGTNLSSNRAKMGGVGDGFSGYFMGGQTTPSPSPANNLSVLDKLTYSTDTISTVPPSFLMEKSSYAITGNLSFAYYLGGIFTSSLGKITYSSDTVSYTPVRGSVARSWHSATGNSSTGYFGGGIGNSFPIIVYSLVEKLTYSGETLSVSPTATLSLGVFPGVWRSSAIGSSSGGYFYGGENDSIGGSNQVTKLIYASDTTQALPSSTMPIYGLGRSAIGNSLSGYFAGGGNSPSTYTSRMDRLSFSTETGSLISQGNLSVNRAFHASSSAKANALDPKLWRRFSDGFETTNPALIPQATPTPQTALVSYSRAGYFGGGINPSVSATYSMMDKLTYSTDTTVAALSGANLSLARQLLAATGSSTAGYFSGGTVPIALLVSTTDRLTYSTDLTIATPTASLSSARYSSIAAGNQTAGYFAGGYFPQTSIIDKLNYSTEQTSLLPGTNLTQPRSSFSGVGNLNAGYFAGDLGNPITTTIDKLTYSTETVASLAPTYLKFSRQSSAATGNSTAGYFGGGFGSGVESRMEKLTYSTDTTAVLPSSANLSLARYRLAATGSSTAGYFGGGIITPGVGGSRMDKLTYSTDTTAAAPSGANLSLARYGLAASSNGSNGFPQSAILPVIV